jgi:hypothetical protein
MQRPNASIIDARANGSWDFGNETISESVIAQLREIKSCRQRRKSFSSESGLQLQAINSPDSKAPLQRKESCISARGVGALDRHQAHCYTTDGLEIVH